ncbi:MAG: polyprenyl synthetase family protein [Armatimonadetes bacterium]|nr:polyprenyl synthetase family protein [Armatimonadota bacterium]CUU34492.1 farnesyl-diphosphate synthase [Armatimonadetes bacterium DC]
MQGLFEAYARERVARIEQALESYLPTATSRLPRILPEAMRYAVLGQGKRLRPLLCGAAAEAVGGSLEQVLPTACAIELIHAFSLVHDDLPALDNDELRRGKPTVWKQYGEAMAILAGDALLVHAFGLLARQAEQSPMERVLQTLRLLCDAVGIDGMVGGQVEDILSEGEPVDAEKLAYIHTHKTGALIRASVLSGAILAGASESQRAALDAYSQSLGLAFQIVDDILNETGDPQRLGKSAGTDRAHQKATYPRLYGLETARRHAHEAIQRALDSLHGFDAAADPLRWIAQFTVERDF